MKKLFTTAIAFCSLVFSANAQDDGPLPFFQGINKAMAAVNVKYLSYMSAVSHGSKVRKAEKKRQELLDQIDKSRYAVMELPYYKGDKTLTTATIDYLKLISNDMNENYSKIVNLEDIAEQSYDNMEAYLLLRKKVSEKMEEAGNAIELSQEEYCKKYNIKLSRTEDEMSQKMKKANEVSDYHDKIYLIFFKCNAQETELMAALDKKNITAIEQIKGSLLKYAEEGQAKLDTMKHFPGDPTLKMSCKKALDFFKKEAGKMTVYTDYIIKEESFEQLKKKFEGSAKSQNDQAEIDKYNKGVNELNAALKMYNQNNENLNSERDVTYNNWNEANKVFLDNNMPYAK